VALVPLALPRGLDDLDTVLAALRAAGTTAPEPAAGATLRDRLALPRPANTRTHQEVAS
jgi:hypothetical protein